MLQYNPNQQFLLYVYLYTFKRSHTNVYSTKRNVKIKKKAVALKRLSIKPCVYVDVYLCGWVILQAITLDNLRWTGG